MNEITIAITSCGRYDLLQRTITSLVKYWDGNPPKELLIYEDAEIHGSEINDYKALIARWLDNFCPFEVFGIGQDRKGQIIAIDTMYSRITTPYIFHCEDDWEFDRSGFVADSMKILEAAPTICQVWIRYPNDRNKHPVTGQIMSINGVRCQMMSTRYKETWRGFSFNPGLRRLDDYEQIGAYSKLTLFNRSRPYESEIAVGEAYYNAGFKAATLLSGYVRHTGNQRHVN